MHPSRNRKRKLQGRAGIVERLRELRTAHRGGEKGTLHLVAPMLFQEGKLRFRLHPFGHDSDAQAKIQNRRSELTAGLSTSAPHWIDGEINLACFNTLVWRFSACIGPSLSMRISAFNGTKVRSTNSSLIQFPLISR